MRLIDVDNVIRSLRDWQMELAHIDNSREFNVLDMIIRGIENEPTVDAVEVVHGEWCWEGKFKACSQCGSYIEWDETLGANFWNYCPHCGAKMDEVKND